MSGFILAFLIIFWTYSIFKLGYDYGKNENEKNEKGINGDIQKFYDENFGKIKNSFPLFSVDENGNGMINHVKDDDIEIIKSEAKKVGASIFISISKSDLIYTFCICYDLQKEKEKGSELLWSDYKSFKGDIKEKAMEYC